MEAKDIKWCPQHGYPLPCDKCGMPLSQPQQREIYEKGKRAGIKEGIRKAIDNLKMHHCIVDVEARLKEIEDD